MCRQNDAVTTSKDDDVVVVVMVRRCKPLFVRNRTHKVIIHTAVFKNTEVVLVLLILLVIQIIYR